MKKLLSLTLVLMLLFTTISFTSVSAATMEVSLVKADLSAATTINDYTVSGTDAGKIANPSLNQKSTGTYTSSDGKTYNKARSLSLTTPSAAGIGTDLGIASDEKIIKISQDANTSILRFFMGDGSLSAKTGDVIKYKIKVYYTDFVSESGYTKDGVAVPATKMETVPETWNDFQWGYLKENKASSGRTGLGLRTVATNKWVQLEYTYEITSDTDADLTSYGIAAERYSYNADAGYKNFPSTIYIAQPEIVKVVEVPSSNVAVTKIGEGTVTGGGEIATGSTATLTAAPEEGYHFAGWYEKGADQSAANLLSANATYAFTVTADTNVVAVFEKDAVNSWIELSRITFTNDLPANTNIWSKDASWTNVNHVEAVTTYTDAEITAPDTSCGDGVLKIDSSLQTNSAYGMVDGRIGYIPGYKVRFENGKKYRVSFWIYIAETAKEKEAGEEMYFSWGPYKNSSTVTEGDTVKVGEWVKLSREFTADASWANAYTGLRLSPANIEAVNKEKDYDNNASVDSIILGYIDEVVFEKFDDVTVSAEATNGTVYGTGSYVRGTSVTLNAGADAGYKFAGYYTKDTDTLISANPTYTFTANADTTIVAKFVQEDAFTYPSNVIYHFGSEDSDVGVNNNWMYIPTGADGAYKQDSAAPHNTEITYKDLAAEGIYKPYESAEFGAKLYQQKRLDGDIKSQVSGRFRCWETGTETNTASTKYKAGAQYKFTWWVMPVSMQLANGEESEPATTKLTVNMQYSASATAGLSKTFTLNVGEWNKLEWEFVATEAMTQIAPGLRYDWATTKNAETELITVANWALYDEIQVEEITSWQFGDTKTPSGWVCRGGKTGMDTAFHGTSKDNCSIMHVETYDKIGVDKASADAGDHLFVFDTARPNASEANYNPTEGSIFWPEGGEKMSYEDAYALYSSYETITGDLAGRFNTIASAGTLTIGKTYKISLKVYIDEIRNLKEEGCPVVADATNKVVITGTNTGSKPVGDGKQVSKVVSQDTWTEISYTFKATEAGATYAPSLRIDFGVADHTKFPTLAYVDDVKVERVYVDDLDLVIEDGETEVTATATVYDIKSGDTVDAIVIIAGYDVDGKLVSVSFSNGGASKALAVGDTLDAAYTKVETVDSYVAFLWDDLTNIRPYVLPVPLSTEVTE